MRGYGGGVVRGRGGEGVWGGVVRGGVVRGTGGEGYGGGVVRERW